MLTVVTPAASRRLTTVSRARAMLGTPSSEDVKLGVLIDQASAVADTFCRRVFARETVKETFSYAPVSCRSDGGLLLERGPVVSIEAVIGNGAPIALPGYSYDPHFGALYRMTGSSLYGWGWHTSEVTYVAGYTLPSDAENATWTLPADVERAAILLVAAYRSSSARDPLIRSESVESVGSTSWWVPGSADALPEPEAERLLRPYRTILLG